MVLDDDDDVQSGFFAMPGECCFSDENDTYMHIYLYVCIDIYSHVQTRIYIYTHTHIHYIAYKYIISTCIDGSVVDADDDSRI